MRRREAVRPDRRCFSYTVCCWTTCGHSRGSYRESFGAVTLANSYFFLFFCVRRRPRVECSLTWVKEKPPRRALSLRFWRKDVPPASPLNLNLGQVLTPPQPRVIHQWKRNLVFTTAARLLLLHEQQSQGCGRRAGGASSAASSVEPPENQGLIQWRQWGANYTN